MFGKHSSIVVGQPMAGTGAGHVLGPGVLPLRHSLDSPIRSNTFRLTSILMAHGLLRPAIGSRAGEARKSAHVGSLRSA